MINRIRHIKQKRLSWIHAVTPGEVEIQYLRDNFEFHPLDLEDCMKENQRPKIDAYDTYVFIVLMFPYYDRKQKKILATEVDFFVGKDFVITVADERENVVASFFDDCMKSEVLRERYMSSTPAQLLYELLRRLQEAIFPMLDHIATDTNDLEQQLFIGAERRMVHDILSIKRNIVNFRRVMNAHKNIIKKLISIRKQRVFSLSPDMEIYFDGILDRTKDIWEILEIQKETINALHETNESLISFKLNDIMKILTAISVSMLPATLIASIFGMNAINMPIVRHPMGFWILIGFMLVVMLAILSLFRKNDWL